jgi:hypothetical protein
MKNSEIIRNEISKIVKHELSDDEKIDQLTSVVYWSVSRAIEKLEAKKRKADKYVLFYRIAMIIALIISGIMMLFKAVDVAILFGMIAVFFKMNIIDERRG